MKRWSIKFKIIFLYTLFFALLITLEFYLLRTSANQILNSQAEQDIVNSANAVANSIQIEDDGVYIETLDEEEHFNYYHDGVIYMFYEGNQVVFGQAPSNFDETTAIHLNTVKTQDLNGMSWLVYDLSVEKGYTMRAIYDLTPISSSTQQVFLITEILSPILVLISAVGVYIIIRRSFKPIRDIYQTASEIKEKEDYSKRIKTSNSKDEVHRLAEMVNLMLDHVEQSMNREKQFSSNVSHELRTPLTVMQAQAEYLLEQTKDETKKTEIKTIIHQIAFMENIVTQLLEITRTRQISKEEMDIIDLHELIKLTGESLTPKLEEKNISFTINAPIFSTKIYCNQTMMIRAFTNLITNAIKYNKENGTIMIRFKKENNQLITMISDTGVGIAKDKLEQIFNPFYRVDESRNQNNESIGLGLSLVREVILLHNGEIQVESIEGVGTTFFIHLPLNK